jgi:hypothetical protein
MIQLWSKQGLSKKYVILWTKRKRAYSHGIFLVDSHGVKSKLLKKIHLKELQEMLLDS